MTHNPYRLDWMPDLAGRNGDVYQAIADTIADDIKTGRLKPGTRLPPQRLLAYTLGLNPGTVNKAYRLAMQRGLISGEVGRGSFVRGGASGGLSWPNEDPYARAIDFCDNFPCAIKNADLFKKQLTALAATPYFAQLLQYQQNSAWPGHQSVAASWVSRCGVAAEPRNILITSGALHAGFISLMTLCRSGDTILSEEFTSQAVKGAAQRLKLRLHGIKMDRQGILPDHLECLLKAHKVAAVYLVPTLHNPTATLLSMARRKAVAKLLERYGVPLIEDDVFAPLLDEPSPPISSFMTNGFYIAGLSKALAPTLRLAFLSVPERHVADAMTNLRITSWLASPLLVELAANLIARGDADKLIKDQRAEIRRRQSLAKEVLSGFDLSAHANAPHCWLRLPAPWRAAQFKDALAKREVLAEATDSFVVDRANPTHAIRICLGTPPSFERVKEGLAIIRETLADA